MAALEKSFDQVVREFVRVPKNKGEQLVADFVSEGIDVEQVQEADGTYTVRAHIASPRDRNPRAGKLTKR